MIIIVVVRVWGHTNCAFIIVVFSLHLHNIMLWENQRKEASRVTSLVHRYGEDDQRAIVKFGFSIPTSCGYILQSNAWEENWTVSCANFSAHFLFV